MRTRNLLLAAMLAMSAGAGAQMPTPPPAPPPGPIAMERDETMAAARLTVSSPAFADDALIPPHYSRYGDNISPPLAWQGAPARTRTYALIVDDPDGKLKPVTHWTMWNIRADQLPEGVPNGPATPPLAGRRHATPVAAVQGATTMRTTGYAGPHPPLGDPPHHYHFQVFALDAALSIAPGADREALLGAMRGHVLARGEVVGRYGQAIARAAP